MRPLLRLAIAIGFFCASAAAVAAPVYLDCAVTNGTTAVTWNITLDEETGNISYSIPALGASYRYHGTFTRDSVSFDTVEISRLDLSFKRTVMISGSIKSETGLCKIVRQPARQF
jgi:hypothetical protein